MMGSGVRIPLAAPPKVLDFTSIYLRILDGCSVRISLGKHRGSTPLNVAGRGVGRRRSWKAMRLDATMLVQKIPRSRLAARGRCGRLLSWRQLSPGADMTWHTPSASVGHRTCRPALQEKHRRNFTPRPDAPCSQIPVVAVGCCPGSEARLMRRREFIAGLGAAAWPLAAPPSR
jgi:hypothetical protein